ncbi:MAG: hypothetical protein IJ109_02890 [Firmicutes bacterium]|nr:hypothetical protein [Bacillota bacterium]
MDGNQKKLYRQLQSALTQREFLRTIGVTKKTMQKVLDEALLRQAARQLAEVIAAASPAEADAPAKAGGSAHPQVPVDPAAVLEAVRPLMGALQRAMGTAEGAPGDAAEEIPAPEPAGGWLSAAYRMILYDLYPQRLEDAGPAGGKDPAGEQEPAQALRPAVYLYCEVLHTVLEQERSGREALPYFDIDFLTREQAAGYSACEEYLRLTSLCRKHYIREFLVISGAVNPFQLLSHVAGVHYVAMHMARQLEAKGVPVDLALVSGAAAAHDIGKFGCRDFETNRIPHLHYYYTDELLQRAGLPAIAHTASNHSTWDLELENLSCENLLLIYADFRVKSRRDGEGHELACFYSLEEAFDVILQKLENVDEAKRERYERVYSKLRDFEEYMKSLGASPELDGELDPSAAWEDPALLDGAGSVQRLKFLAISHNIEVMHRFSDEKSFADLLEDARSERDWKNIRAYLNTLEEYFTYMTAVQKQMTIRFLREMLIFRAGDIRRQSASLIGRIIACYDEKYRKELPRDAALRENRISSGQLWLEHLQAATMPSRQRTERQQRWIGYSLKQTLRALLTNADPQEKAWYLDQFLQLLHTEKRSDAVVFILLDTILEVPVEMIGEHQIRQILTFCEQAMQRSVIEIRVAVLRNVCRIAEEGDAGLLSEEVCGRLADLTRVHVSRPRLVSVVFLKYRTLQAIGLRGRAAAKYHEELEEMEEANAAIFRENLKIDIPWVIKAVNIDVMLDELSSGRRQEAYYVATHLSNLLKVSERVTVRHKAGRSLLRIIDLLNREQRQEIVIELTKGLEIGDFQFSKYIPEYLGVMIMHLHPEELDEVLYELHHLLQTGNEKVVSVTLDTLGVMLRGASDYRVRFEEAPEAFRQRRDKIIGMMLYGMANYHEMVGQEAFLVLGQGIFGSGEVSAEEKAQLFRVMGRKMLTLIEDSKDEPLRFFNNAASLNHIYRFISDYELSAGPLLLEESRKAAFFPGTFDPFSLGHKGIVQAIRAEGFDVYLALDEFSWSKNTQARLYRKRIMTMSCADEIGVYIFPDNQPINIANPGDIRKLKDLLPGKEVYIVVGSDVIAGASSYRMDPEPDSIHSLNHIVFRRDSAEQTEESIASYRKGRAKITGEVLELKLPVHLEDISSTRIRDNIDNNREIASLIDPVVQSYIYDNALYMRQPMYKSILSAQDLKIEMLREKGHLAGITISDGSRDGLEIAQIRVHPVEMGHLYEEFGDQQLAAWIREKAPGKTLIIHRAEALRNAIDADGYQLVLTEVLSAALEEDYTYAIYHDPKPGKDQAHFVEVLTRQGFREIVVKGRPTGCYSVDMHSPVTILQNMNTVLKSPFNKNPRVEETLAMAHIRLQHALTRLFPDTLILSYNSAIMYHKLIHRITKENGVPARQQKKRKLGPYMCVPFGKILNGMAVPNTVTKTLHLQKSFAPDLESFRIREYPNYAGIDDQVRTIRSFRREVILVDDLLHKGYRMQRLDPVIRDNGLKVHKIIVGILSGRGRDLMTVQGRDVDSIYFIPNLRAWFVESSLYPFIGGDGVERHTGTIDDDLTAINLILPYVMPRFLLRRCSREAIYEFSEICLENTRTILKVLEEEYQREFQRKLTLQRISEAVFAPRLIDVGQCLDFDRTIAASAYVEDDIERLQRLKNLI